LLPQIKIDAFSSYSDRVADFSVWRQADCRTNFKNETFKKTKQAHGNGAAAFNGKDVCA